MNDTYILVAMGVGLAFAIWYFVIRDKDRPEVENPPVDPDFVPGSTNVGRRAEGRIPESAKSPNTGPRPLPSKAELDKMTKANLEELARVSYGIELDRRQTKANMIADLKKQHKAL